jgi:hypothetical protein
VLAEAHPFAKKSHLEGNVLEDPKRQRPNVWALGEDMAAQRRKGSCISDLYAISHIDLEDLTKPKPIASSCLIFLIIESESLPRMTILYSMQTRS